MLNDIQTLERDELREVERVVREQLAPAEAEDLDEQVLRAVDQMASVTHMRSWANVPAAYAANVSWIEANGYTIVCPAREVYLCGACGDNDDTTVTEVQFTVEKR